MEAAYTLEKFRGATIFDSIKTSVAPYVIVCQDSKILRETARGKVRSGAILPAVRKIRAAS